METKTMSFRDTIILAMSEEMRRDENVFLMGEDVGVFGGDFGTSVGMLEEFGPERVRDCPISEAAISGAAAGAAMTGLRPIVDMTFMDFSVIAMDNIVNQAAKTRYMFGGKGQVPMTVRCAAGNGVGSAAQHSQSLESWFTHIPGLKVVAPGTPADMIYSFLKSFINVDDIVSIFDEHSRNSISSATLMDMFYVGHFLDIRRDSITVVNAIENDWQVPDRSHIYCFMENTFVGRTITKEADNDFSSILHLLTKGCTNSDSHTTTYDTIGTKVTSIKVGDMHRTTFTFTGSSVFTKDFSHHSVEVNSFGNSLSVTTVV